MSWHSFHSLTRNNSFYALLLLCMAALLGLSRWWLGGRYYHETPLLFEKLDTAALTSISFQHNKDTLTLEQTPLKIWKVNGGTSVDPFLLNSLMHILMHARVRRELGGAENTRLNSLMSKEGCRISLALKDKPFLVFDVWGTPQQAKSYVRKQKESNVNEIYLPDEHAYIAGIFFLQQIQWRTRLLFSSTPYTLHAMSYQDLLNPENSFNIEAHAQQATLVGMAHVDKSKLYDYLSRFEAFYTNEYINPKAHPVYDSLLENKQPFVRLEIKDLYADHSKIITLHQRKDDPYVLIEETNDEGQVAYSLCEERRLAPLVVPKGYFTESQQP